MRIAAGASGPCPAICSAICSANRRGMLLDLYVQKARARPVSVHSLCIAAMVPPTTALRWIKVMTEKGWLVRARDPADGRRVYVGLGADALVRLDLYFAGLPGF